MSVTQKPNSGEQPRYLYTGWLPDFGTCRARMQGVIDSGRNVTALSYRPFIESLGARLAALQTVLGFGPGITAYNRKLIETARQFRPEVIWIDKGHYVTAATLRALKEINGATLVCFNSDDLAFKQHGWRLHRPGIPEYDVYITTNKHNYRELSQLPSTRVLLSPMGYDRELFNDDSISTGEVRHDVQVGYIGHWEPATERFFLKLVELGLPLRVRGGMWVKAKHRHELKDVIEPIGLYQQDYVNAIGSTKINLGINSAQNRNSASGRTFEIPAAGGFLLAERTPDHEESYVEGHEAEFFGSAEELADKARYYLAHEAARHRIAVAGRHRCVSSGYSWQERMRTLLPTIEQGVKVQ